MSANPPIVIDCGTNCLKAGLSGEGTPKIVQQNVIGRKNGSDELLFGEKYELQKDIITKYPVRRGRIENFHYQKTIFDDVFDRLKVTPKDKPLLMIHPIKSTIGYRKRLLENLFESNDSSCVCLCVSGILSLYGYGKTTGCVVDCGEGLTQSLCVFDGFQVKGSEQQIELGGYDVTEYFHRCLRRNGFVFHGSYDWEQVRSVKENKRMVYVCRDLKKEEVMNERGDVEQREMILPDGTKIEITTPRYRCCEVLFNPHILGSEMPGVSGLCLSSIKSSDMDLRTKLYSSILLTGGSSLFRGFGERFFNELKKKAPKSKKVAIESPVERQYLPWIGGGIFGSLPTFDELGIKKSEYQENGGLKILHEKSLLC